MKRYNAVVGGVYDNSVMVEERDGDWVWYEDVEAQCAELLEACESLLRFAERDRLPTDVAVNDACAAIAKAKGAQP